MAYRITNPDQFRKNVLSNLQKTFIDISDDITFFMNLEKGVFNYAIKEANSKKIINKWDNIFFAQLSVDRLRTIFINFKNPIFQELIKSDEIAPQTLSLIHI